VIANAKILVIKHVLMIPSNTSSKYYSANNKVMLSSKYGNGADILNGIAVTSANTDVTNNHRTIEY
jgi:hypothetical protein